MESKVDGILIGFEKVSQMIIRDYHLLFELIFLTSNFDEILSKKIPNCPFKKILKKFGQKKTLPISMFDT